MLTFRQWNYNDPVLGWVAEKHFVKMVSSDFYSFTQFLVFLIIYKKHELLL